MSRRAGSRNADYEETRMRLARAIRQKVLDGDVLQVSLREMAAAARVSVATLQHYFPDRHRVVIAVMESIGHDGAPYLASASKPLLGDVRKSLLQLVTDISRAWLEFGVGRMHSTSLAAGLSSAGLGMSYVDLILEPLLKTAEERIRQHVELGDLGQCNARYAGLQLLSPVVLGLLHQHSLGGALCRPLDLPDFCRVHVDSFLRAHGPVVKARRRTKARVAGV